MVVERADNPSDINWKNKQITFHTKLVRTISFIAILAILMCLVYGTIVFELLKRGQAEIDILPQYHECDSMSIMFEKHPD